VKDDPVTQRQLKRLGFYNLPFSQTSLTEEEALRLIEFFAQVDPEREMQYQNQPAEEEKRTQLRELIKKLPSGERADFAVTANLTNGEAIDRWMT
jgi:hypothetical protein